MRSHDSSSKAQTTLVGSSGEEHRRKGALVFDESKHRHTRLIAHELNKQFLPLNHMAISVALVSLDEDLELSFPCQVCLTIAHDEDGVPTTQSKKEKPPPETGRLQRLKGRDVSWRSDVSRVPLELRQYRPPNYS